jgi:predicted secreted Zn-dependent protease
LRKLSGKLGGDLKNIPTEVYATYIELSDMMIPVLMDGWRKREAGTKPHWKQDKHYQSMMRHIYRYNSGELVDKDSGCHPLVHTAVRALMIAGQEASDV